MVYELSARENIEVVAKIDPVEEGCQREINISTLNNAEVCIDFSHPAAVLNNIRSICELKKNLVVGTTGWAEHLDEVHALVAHNKTGLIYGSNLSIGMNLFYEIIRKASELMSDYDEYDVYGLELHHRQKVDSPSGTAKELSKILLEKSARKSKALYDKIDRKIEPEELHFASVRAGFIPGTHTIGFDSEADSIELTHRVKNRTGLALGAIKVAKWIAGKEGIYTFQDFIRAQ
jgi:4-hydroxy-tetrahydrodipicolinate reductase